MKFKLLAALALIISLFTINATSVYAADLASVTLSGASSIEVNHNFTVTVRENSGSTTVNLVTAVLSYDSSKVQFVGFDDSSSEFDFKGAQSGGAGTVSVKRSLYGGAYTGTHTVVGVTFKSLAGSGSTTISVADGTNVANPQTGGSPVWDGAHNSTGIALTTPAAATPTPATNPASNNGATKKTVTTQTTPKNNHTTAPTAPKTDEATTPEVKGDEAKKSEKKDEKKEDQAKNASGKSSVWTGILVAIAAGFAFFAGRRYVAQRNAAIKNAEAAKAKAAAAAKPTKKLNKKSK